MQWQWLFLFFSLTFGKNMTMAGRRQNKVKQNVHGKVKEKNVPHLPKPVRTHTHTHTEWSLWLFFLDSGHFSSLHGILPFPWGMACARSWIALFLLTENWEFRGPFPFELLFGIWVVNMGAVGQHASYSWKHSSFLPENGHTAALYI